MLPSNDICRGKWHLCRWFSKPVVLKPFSFVAHCKTYKHFVAHFTYKIKNILIYFKLWIKISIQMGFFSFLKYTFMIFAAHLATSSGTQSENRCSKCLWQWSLIDYATQLGPLDRAQGWRLAVSIGPNWVGPCPFSHLMMEADPDSETSHDFLNFT
jgi:hypothetical protein